MIASRTAAPLPALILGMVLAMAPPGGAGRPALAGGKAKAPPVSVERADDGEPVIVHEGEASFYGGTFHGRRTANGEVMNQNKPTAASRELPLGTKATVTNRENGKSVDVIVNDRGPYANGRVIDLSKNAASTLDMIEDGTAPVRVEAKPSEQPSDTAREKVEAKVGQAGKPDSKPDNKPAGAAQAGGSGGGAAARSGSAK